MYAEPSKADSSHELKEAMAGWRETGRAHEVARLQSMPKGKRIASYGLDPVRAVGAWDSGTPGPDRSWTATGIWCSNSLAVSSESIRILYHLSVEGTVSGPRPVCTRIECSAFRNLRIEPQTPLARIFSFENGIVYRLQIFYEGGLSLPFVGLTPLVRTPMCYARGLGTRCSLRQR